MPGTVGKDKIYFCIMPGGSVVKNPPAIVDSSLIDSSLIDLSLIPGSEDLLEKKI